MSSHDEGAQAVLTALAVLCAGGSAIYAWAWMAQPQSRRRAWWRPVCFALGSVLIVSALLPPLSRHAHHDLQMHMWQHLLLGMWGPIGVVLGRPVTTLLGALPTRHAKALIRVLHSLPVRVLGNPVVALVLNLGGMAALYLSPLFARMHHDVLLHGLIHFHFIAAGSLFSWSVLGLEPAAGRCYSPRMRLTVLWAGTAAHAVLGKAMYAYGFPRGTAFPPADLEAAAKIMYYGGDASELLLIVLLMALSPLRRRRSERALPSRAVNPAGP